MAQETEVVVFEVDVSQYEKSLADLTKSINGLKDTQAALQKQTKEGATGAAESLEKVNAQLKLQQQEYRTTQNILVGYTGAQQKNVNTLDFAKNSIQANRDLLKQLTAQYINTTAPSEKFTNQIKKLSDKLKEQEGAIGDNRRNVGAYAEGFKTAFGEIAKGIPALGSFQKAQQGVNMVMSANPIGGVVTVLSALLEIMQSNAEVADKVSFVFAGINKGFKFVIDTIATTVGSFDKLTEAVKHPIDFLLNFGKGLKEAAVNGYESAQSLDNLVEKTGEYSLAIEKNNTEIEKQRTILLNKKKADVERKKAAEEIIKLETDNANKRVELAKIEIDAFNQQLENQKLSSEEKRKQYDLENNLQKALTEQQSSTRKAQIEIDKIFTEESIENQKKRDELAAKEIARLETIANENARLEQVRIETLQVGLQKEESLYELAFEKRMSDFIKLNLTETQIEEIKQRELNEIRSKYAVKAVEIEQGKYVKIAELQDNANQEMADKAVKSQQSYGDSIVQNITQISNAITGILSSVSNLIQQTAEQNIQSLQEQAGDGAAEQKRVAAESRQIKLKAWKEARAINLTMAVMNTANAVMAQISNPTPYVGFVLAALAAATGAIQIATIAKQKPPSFALGGKVVSIGGKSHSDGGTPIHVGGQHVAEAEAGEGLFVMKKDAYNDIQMLSGWNQRYGGRSFTGNKTNFAADGGEIQIPSDGGFSTRSIRSATDNAMQVEMAIMNGFKKAPAPELSIVELNSKQTSRNRSVDVVSL